MDRKTIPLTFFPQVLGVDHWPGDDIRPDMCDSWT